MAGHCANRPRDAVFPASPLRKCSMVWLLGEEEMYDCEDSRTPHYMVTWVVAQWSACRQLQENRFVNGARDDTLMGLDVRAGGSEDWGIGKSPQAQQRTPHCPTDICRP